MDIKNVTVAGSGVLGSQIAFQTAYSGYQVTVYDINDEVLEKSKQMIKDRYPMYQADIGATEADLAAGFARLTFQSDLAKAVEQADLVIEAIPEVASIKQEFYQKLAKVAPERTIFATNSSTMLPSQFVEYTGRPAKFLALHFANLVWVNNTAEIMQQPATDETVFATVVEFARSIGMVPLPIYKEQPGYILNSLLVPLLDAAQKLLINEIADPETIDKTWMIATKAPRGPFAILDVVGLTTPYNIALEKAKATGDPVQQAVADFLKTEYIDKGKLGIATGEGFYKYPNPSYLDPMFTKQ